MFGVYKNNFSIYLSFCQPKLIKTEQAPKAPALLTINCVTDIIISYINGGVNMAIIGGLNSVPEVKVLILYILNYAGGMLSK